MYWKQKGPENTENVAKLVIEKAQELQIRHIVVASNSGNTVKHFWTKDWK